MNPPNLQAATPTDLEVTLVLILQASGRIIASAMEFPSCYVEAATREAAIADLTILLSQHLQKIEMVPVKIPLPPSTPKTNPWHEMFGALKDSQYFDEVVEIVSAEREKLGDEDIDPAFYLSEKDRYFGF
jgi:predicted RNase H-like HicB family nuclease